jgi:hypothetical protein
MPGLTTMAADTAIAPKTPDRRRRRATPDTQKIDIVFSQAKLLQDLLRFECDTEDTGPAVVIIQEYARAVRLLFITARWSKLVLSVWHSEMQFLLRARASPWMGLDIWKPLDDFLDTYIFEMEIQPLSKTDAKAKKLIKRGLLGQLHEIANRQMERCHKDLCVLFGKALFNWRSLDIRLLACKRYVWADCVKQGSLRAEIAADGTKKQRKTGKHLHVT